VDRSLIPALSLGLLVLAQGCTKWSYDSVQWQEEITLHDGRILAASRVANRRVAYEWGQMMGGTKFEIDVKDSTTGQKTHWDGQDNQRPLIIDFDREYAYLVYVDEECEFFTATNNRRVPPYKVLRRRTVWYGRWQELDLTSLPSSLRKINLMPRSPNPGAATLIFANQLKELIDDIVHGENQNGYIQDPIPRDYESWNYKYKDKSTNGCPR